MRVFNIDITRKGISPVVQVTEYDAMSRFVTLVLRDGAADYEEPEGATYSVWYKTADSHGWYDTITEPDNGTHPAVVADGNEYTIEIAEQATTSCGELALCITAPDGYQLTVSGIITRSDDIPGYDGEEVENYYNVFITRMQENAARAENAADIAVAYGATVEVDEDAQQLNITHHSDTEGGVGWLFGSAVTSEAEGSVAAFPDGANDVAVKSLVAEITPILSGSGDPSPTNVRPISGRTGLTVTVQSGDTQNTYPISWQTEAGAIYGGTLDVVSGVLTVDRVCVTFTENDAWATAGSVANGNLRYYVSLPVLPDTTKSGATTMCSCAVYSAGNNGAWGTYNYGVTNNGFFMMKNGDGGAGFTSLDDFKTWLSTHTLQLCYYLATPTTYQLSPTEIKTLLGGNTIYTDAGAVSVEYVADTKLYIDNKVAELQALILEN